MDSQTSRQLLDKIAEQKVKSPDLPEWYNTPRADMPLGHNPPRKDWWRDMGMSRRPGSPHGSAYEAKRVSKPKPKRQNIAPNPIQQHMKPSELEEHAGMDKYAQYEGSIKSLSDASRREGIDDIVRTGLIAGGGAAGLRGIQGLFNLITRSGESPGHIRSGISPLPVPYPIYESHEEEEEEDEELKEQELFEEFNKAAQREDLPGTSQVPFAKDEHPFYYPGMLMAALGGAYGGWKGMDYLLDRRRQSEVDEELEDAKQEFQEALTSHYTPGHTATAKVAAQKSAAYLLGEELDSLFHRFEAMTDLEKQADFASDPLGSAGKGIEWLGRAPGRFLEWIQDPRTQGKALGMYGTYAIPSLLMGYIAAKGLSDKFSKKKLLEEAEKRRAVQRAAKRPAEIYAIPSPVTVEEEEE